jgi:WD40 repeat protein
MTGGISGKAVVAGKPEASPLYTLAAHLEDPKMPPNKPKIPQRELDTLRKWIEGELKEKGDGKATPSAKPDAGLVAAAPLARNTPVTALAVHQKLALAAVPGEKQVLLIDTAANKVTGALAFPEGELHSLKFSRDGTLLLAAGGVGGQSGAVVGFDIKSWKRVFTLADETDAVLAADIHPDNKLVVLGGPNKVVKVASVPDGKVLHTFRKPTDWVLTAGFSPDGLLVAAGDRIGGLYVWETRSGKEFYTLRGHTKGVTGIAWRADADVLLSSSQDGTVRAWDLHTGDEKAKIDAHATGVQDVTVTAGKVATTGRDGSVRVCDVNGKKLAEFIAADEVLKVTFTADGKSVLSGDWSGEVRSWPTAGGEGIKLPLPVEKKPATLAIVTVPNPELPPAPAVKPTEPAAVPVSGSDLERKRATLKAIEDAAEKMKDEAARNPQNAALAKAYRQLCEAALTMKAEVIAAERK